MARARPSITGMSAGPRRAKPSVDALCADQRPRNRHWFAFLVAARPAARHDGAQLPPLISEANRGGDVWGDTAYRSRANDKFLAENGRRSQIHRKKPKSKPVPKH